MQVAEPIASKRTFVADPAPVNTLGFGLSGFRCPIHQIKGHVGAKGAPPDKDDLGGYQNHPDILDNEDPNHRLCILSTGPLPDTTS